MNRIAARQLAVLESCDRAIAERDAQIPAMREWIADCDWGDLEACEVQHLTDAAVLRGVARWYDGGVAGFMADCA